MTDSQLTSQSDAATSDSSHQLSEKQLPEYHSLVEEPRIESSRTLRGQDEVDYPDGGPVLKLRLLFARDKDGNRIYSVEPELEDKICRAVDPILYPERYL